MMYDDNIVFPHLFNKIILTSKILCLIHYFIISHKWGCCIWLVSSVDHNCVEHVQAQLSYLSCGQSYLFPTVLLPSEC